MDKYYETQTMELKEKYTDSIVKEIVSFLNSDGGTLIVGIKDDGTVVGVDKLDETLRKISDVITTQIEPNPQDEITTEVRFDEKKALIVLNISKGGRNIYCQKKYGFSSNGCTIRIGTTCKEMTSEQIKIRYEQNFIDNEYIEFKANLKDEYEGNYRLAIGYVSDLFYHDFINQNFYS